MTQAEEDDNTKYYNAKQEPNNHHVAQALTGTDKERSKQWLEGVAGENDNVKDLVIQSLWKNDVTTCDDVRFFFHFYLFIYHVYFYSQSYD